MTALVWKKAESRYYIETMCKQYTVTKAVASGKVKYCAWHGSTCLNIVDDPQVAKDRCQKHKDSGQ